MGRVTVSVITTVLNESDTIGALLRSLAEQTREADNIIICDAGSEDATVRIIQRHIEDGLPARLIVERRANRSRGRNLAIEESHGEVIACIDGGCVAKRDWLAHLVEPFESGHPPDVVAGYYEPETDDEVEEAIAAATVPEPEEVDPESFLPSARSVAFRREAWARVGGFPEHSNYAEDTEFDLHLKAAGFRFQFAPEAIVRWRMQASFPAVFRQFLRYARSDGELGHWFGHYTKAFAGLLVFLLLGLLGATGTTAAPIIAVALLAAYWVRYLARARRREAGWYAAFLSPAVTLTVDLAHVLGYLAGFVRRRPRPGYLPGDRPLSIAQITYTYQPIAGGADVYAGQLGELIVNAGHEHCVYQRRTDTEAGDVRFIRNPFRGLLLEFWTQALGLFAMRRQLLSHDVVICHYPHYLLALDLLSLCGRKPVRVGISHGVFWDDAPWWTPRSLLKLLIARWAFRRAHLYLANDTHFLRAMGRKIEPRQGLHSEVAPRVWLIPNGVDTQQFAPTEPASALRDRQAILVPRNLFRNRGVHLAIDAFAQFGSNHQEATLHLAGGGGQPDYVQELHRQVEELGLEDRVIFHGAVSHDALPSYYSAAELTLIPSLCGEGTSLSALESMACGTATICAFVAGLRDLPGPHALPLATALAEIMESVWPERQRIGEAQRAQVLTRYSLAKWRETWGKALGAVRIK